MACCGVFQIWGGRYILCIYLSIHPSIEALATAHWKSQPRCVRRSWHSTADPERTSRVESDRVQKLRNEIFPSIARVLYIFLCQRLSVYDDLISKFFLRLPHTHIPPSPFCPNDDDDDDFILYTDCAPVSWNFRWSVRHDGWHIFVQFARRTSSTFSFNPRTPLLKQRGPYIVLHPCLDN